MVEDGHRRVPLTVEDGHQLVTLTIEDGHRVVTLTVEDGHQLKTLKGRGRPPASCHSGPVKAMLARHAKKRWAEVWRNDKRAVQCGTRPGLYLQEAAIWQVGRHVCHERSGEG